jgi:hypothetical protein
MEHLLNNPWAKQDAADRASRDQAAYPFALAWLGALLAGLALAGLVAYEVYRGFSGVYGP